MDQVSERIEEKRKWILASSAYSLEQIEGIDRITNILKTMQLELIEETIRQWYKTITELEIIPETMDLFTTKYPYYDVNKLFK